MRELKLSFRCFINGAFVAIARRRASGNNRRKLVASSKSFASAVTVELVLPAGLKRKDCYSLLVVASSARLKWQRPVFDVRDWQSPRHWEALNDPSSRAARLTNCCPAPPSGSSALVAEMDGEVVWPGDT